MRFETTMGTRARALAWTMTFATAALTGGCAESKAPPPRAGGEPVPAARPLPDREADRETISLAQQVRAEVRRHDCASAKELLAKIQAHDPAYYQALLTSPVMEGCS